MARDVDENESVRKHKARGRVADVESGDEASDHGQEKERLPRQKAPARKRSEESTSSTPRQPGDHENDPPRHRHRASGPNSDEEDETKPRRSSAKDTHLTDGKTSRSRSSADKKEVKIRRTVEPEDSDSGMDRAAPQTRRKRKDSDDISSSPGKVTKVKRSKEREASDDEEVSPKRPHKSSSKPNTERTEVKVTHSREREESDDEKVKTKSSSRKSSSDKSESRTRRSKEDDASNDVDEAGTKTSKSSHTSSADKDVKAKHRRKEMSDDRDDTRRPSKSSHKSSSEERATVSKHHRGAEESDDDDDDRKVTKTRPSRSTSKSVSQKEPGRARHRGRPEDSDDDGDATKKQHSKHRKDKTDDKPRRHASGRPSSADDRSSSKSSSSERPSADKKSASSESSSRRDERSSSSSERPSSSTSRDPSHARRTTDHKTSPEVKRPAAEGKKPEKHSSANKTSGKPAKSSSNKPTKAGRPTKPAPVVNDSSSSSSSSSEDDYDSDDSGVFSDSDFDDLESPSDHETANDDSRTREAKARRRKRHADEQAKLLSAPQTDKTDLGAITAEYADGGADDQEALESKNELFQMLQAELDKQDAARDVVKPSKTREARERRRAKRQRQKNQLELEDAAMKKKFEKDKKRKDKKRRRQERYARRHGGRPPQYRAVCIGITYKGEKGELKGTATDVKLMSMFLRARGYPKRRVGFMSDTVPGAIWPSRYNMLQQMQWLVNGAEPGDRLFLSYSGHGTKVRDLDGDEEDGYDQALCPVDHAKAGVIIDDDLHSILVHKLKPGVKLTVFVDACHSGTILDLPCVYSTSGSVKGTGLMSSLRTLGKAKSDAAMMARQLTSMTKGTPATVMCISGCKDDQTSADTTSGKNARMDGSKLAKMPIGAMTQALLTAVSRLGPNATVLQIYNHMRRSLVVDGYTQKPQLSTGHKTRLTATFEI